MSQPRRIYNNTICNCSSVSPLHSHGSDKQICCRHRITLYLLLYCCTQVCLHSTTSQLRRNKVRRMLQFSRTTDLMTRLEPDHSCSLLLSLLSAAFIPVTITIAFSSPSSPEFHCRNLRFVILIFCDRCSVIVAHRSLPINLFESTSYLVFFLYVAPGPCPACSNLWFLVFLRSSPEVTNYDLRRCFDRRLRPFPTRVDCLIFFFFF